jgi:hypothetical protein
VQILGQHLDHIKLKIDRTQFKHKILWKIEIFEHADKYFKAFIFEKRRWLLVFRRVEKGGRPVFLGEFIYLPNVHEHLDRYNFTEEQARLIRDKLLCPEEPDINNFELSLLCYRSQCTFDGNPLPRIVGTSVISRIEKKAITMFEFDFQ